MNRLRVVLGFALAPLVVPVAILVLFALLYLLRVGWFRDADYRTVVAAVMVWGAYSLPVAFGVTVVGGLPCYLLSRRRGWTTSRPFLCLGVLLGAAPFLLFDLYVVAHELSRSVSLGWDHVFFGLAPTLKRLVLDIPVASAWAGIGAFCGGIGAMVFWAVAVRPVFSRRGAR